MSPVMSLPLETLSLICEYLEYSHKPSCFAFSLVSKQWRAAALTSLFRKIRIVVSRPDKLQTDVTRWLMMLQSNDSLKRVRRVEIEGRMRIATSDEPGTAYTQWLKDYNEDDAFATIPYYLENDVDGELIQAGEEDDKAWEPLAHLIKRLSGLSDFIYAGLNAFAPCLLETLHSHRQECRLHLHTFQLRSLYPPHYVDPFELELANSPCLHSLRLRYESSGLADRNMVAVLQMASGLAPNLKRVSVSPQSRSGELRDGPYKPPRPWEGFPGTSNQLVLGRHCISSLELTDYGSRTQSVLEAWSKHSDLSALRTLMLRQTMSPEALGWAASSVEFLSLTTLVLDGWLNGQGDTWTGSARDAAASFLSSLPPLKALHVAADLGLGILDAILERHGCTLHRFWLSSECVTVNEETRPTATAAQVHKIAYLCFKLEELKLAIRRSEGNKDEVAIYRSLGQLPRLQDLALTLNCSDPRSGGCASADEEDKEISRSSGGRAACKGQIRAAFINSALDRTLARSIFHTVSQSKPPGAFRLETLKLDVVGGHIFGFGINGLFGNSLFDDMLRVLGRPWLCVRHPRDDKEDEVVVTELDQRAREDAEIAIDDDLWKFDTVFRKIWPGGEESDWRKDWHSFPLQDADGGVTA